MSHIPFITGHRTFDRQSEECLMSGNVIANTQLSFYVRPVHETECNGFTNKPGELFNFDIQQFGRDMDQDVVRFVRGLNRQVIVYQVRHWVGSHRAATRRKIVHGYIVTETDGRKIRAFERRGGFKSQEIIYRAAKHLESGN